MLIEAHPTNMKTPESVLKERNDDDNEYDKLREGFKINEASSITNKEMMEKAKRLGINKKQNDIKKLLKNVFGESIDTAYRTSTFRGIKGLEIIQDIM
jgi:Ca2+-binding EF-hand superfamily protein